MFLTRKNNFHPLSKPNAPQPQNTSLSKKKTFLTVLSKSKSKQKTSRNEKPQEKAMSRSIDRYRSNIGSETAIELSNFTSQRAIVTSKRDVYQYKNTKGHKFMSLILDNVDFQQYELDKHLQPLWNQNSPINKLADCLQGK